MRRPSLEGSVKVAVSLVGLALIAALTGTALHVDYLDRITQEKKAIVEAAQLAGGLSSDEAVRLLSSQGRRWRILSPQEGEQGLLVQSADGASWKVAPDGSTLFADLIRRQRHLLVVALIGFLLAVEIAVFLSYALTRPLKRLAWACEEIAANRWVRLPLVEGPPYEFGLVEKTFNDMVDGLEKGRELERHMARVERLAALGQVIAGVSHEIRNPLAAIRVHLDLLTSSVDDEGKESLSLVERELDRLNGTVSQLLAFGRPPEPIWGELSVEELFHWCRRVIGPSLRQSRVTLEIRTEGDLTLQGDGGRLQEMLLNLTLNALAAMEPEGGILLWTARRDEHQIRIEVSDTGRGITPEVANRLFDPFFTTRPDGTGLGLPIVLRIVDMHGGSLDVRSEPGKTSFVVVLPAERSPSDDPSVDH
jgi:signal transduction histidine kinase